MDGHADAPKYVMVMEAGDGGLSLPLRERDGEMTAG
jgi:hypothetical protein